MGNKNSGKELKIMPFDYKRNQFLIAYGIINIYFFLNIHSVIASINKTFADMYVKELYVDGSNLSPLANLISMPFAGMLATLSIGFLVLIEIIATLLFRFGYFRTEVEIDETVRLSTYIQRSLLYSLLINILVTVFWSGFHQIMLFIFLYLPVPLSTYLFINLRIKRATQ